MKPGPDSGDIRPASRIRDIQPFYVMKILARARELEAQGHDVVHMEVGEPDFSSPEPIVKAGIEALQSGKTHYTPATGLPELRVHISDWYQQQYGINVDPARIVITPGASGALQLVLSVLVEKGKEVLLADPGYPCNRHFIRLLEACARSVAVDSTSSWQLTVEHLEQYWSSNTCAALIASPSNPTGTSVSLDQQRALLDFVCLKKGYLIVDEIYQNLVYGKKPETVLSVSDEVFVVNSFSKYFGMTGWRLGWIVAPEKWVSVIDTLAQNIFLAPSTPAQYAACKAFSPECIDILEQRRQTFHERRDYLLPALRALGFEIPVEPDGAFYLYANCSRFTSNSYQFVEDLLEKAHVAVTPGVDFGNNQASTHIRFAYTTSLEQLHEGVARLQRFLT